MNHLGREMILFRLFTHKLTIFFYRPKNYCTPSLNMKSK